MSSPPGPAGRKPDTRYLPISAFSTFSRPRRGTPQGTPFFRRKRVQRYNHFPNCKNFFSLFTEDFLQPSVQERNGNEIFFLKTGSRGRKAPRGARESAVFGVRKDGKAHMSVQSAINVQDKYIFTGHGFIPAPGVPSVSLLCGSYVPSVVPRHILGTSSALLRPKAGKVLNKV